MVGDTTLSETWKSQTAAPPLAANSATSFGRSSRFLNVFPGSPESARDAREIAVAEHRPVLGHPLRAELVQLGAVRAVVHHDDQDVQPLALDGLQLLHMNHQAAVV